MQIPFVDLKAQYQSIRPEIDAAIANVVSETAFIGGKYVKEFEQKFGELYGINNVISCANGTDSLYIIMRMLGIGSGDEVITVANSWISSSESISQTGATPVFVDVESMYMSIDETMIARVITDKTKAIIVVHLHGQICDAENIKCICDKYNIYMIEDCAQSHFSEYKNVRAGNFGIAGSFSFYPGKNLGAYGDAGCIVTNNDKFAEKCRMFANHGALVKHHHQIEGINSRMDGIQAAILTAKLSYILDWTEKRIANAHLYNKYLSNIEQIKLPISRPGSKHTYHLYVIRTSRRDELKEFLSEKGIDTAIHYPTILPLLSAYKYLDKTDEDFTISYALQHEILSLPMYPDLKEAQIEYISNAIQDFFS